MKTEPKISLQTITPEYAKTLLTKNIGNRKVSERNVNFFYQQIVDDKFILTGDTIKIGADGNLKDGQHRLLGCVKANKPIVTYVANGIDNDAFSVLDTGKSRSAGDVLSMTGSNDPNNLAGAARFVIAFKSGYYNNTSYKIVPTNKQVLEFVELNPEILEMLSFCRSIRRQFRQITLTNLTGLYFVLSGKHQQDADDFFNKYATGIDLTETSPIRHLRERLIKDQLNKSKLSSRDRIALFIFAWNAFREKRKMSQLTLQKNYVFPKPL